jgi:hypothetical protein
MPSTCWGYDMNFDPFTATFEEAQAQPDAHAIDGPVLRWGAAQRIAENRARYEQYPIEGVASCVRFGLVAPDWLAWAFLRQYDSVLNCRVATWDDAFGPAFLPGKHLSTFRLHRAYGIQIQSLFTNDDHRGRKALPRTLEGRTQAARILGITEKQVRTLLPKTRINVKGHKPYGRASLSTIKANDPFSIAAKKAPKN